MPEKKLTDLFKMTEEQKKELLQTVDNLPAMKQMSAAMKELGMDTKMFDEQIRLIEKQSTVMKKYFIDGVKPPIVKES